MPGIVYPQDVQNRVELEARVTQLADKSSRDILWLIKEKKLLPVSFGFEAPTESTKPSITTTALAAARLPGPARLSLFSAFFTRCERVLQRTKGLSSSTFGDNNPITAALVALAHARYSRRHLKAYSYAIERVLEWIDSPGTATPLRGYPALLAIEALRTLETRSPALRRKVTKAEDDLFAWSQSHSIQQVGFYHSSHSAYFDAGELVYLILLGCRLKSLYWTSPVVTDAVQIVFKVSG